MLNNTIKTLQCEYKMYTYLWVGKYGFSPFIAREMRNEKNGKIHRYL